MAGKLEGRVALITGSAGGIGRAAAIRFGGEGAVVICNDLVEAGGQETASIIRAAGGKAEFVRGDVSNAEQAEALIAHAVKHHGRLDCAFNNAGIEGEVMDTHESSERNYDRIMAVNVKGVWLCMKYEIRQMLKQGGGAIVNTSSGAGLFGFPGLPIYVASKHAVLGLTKSAALECASAKIRVNAVCPGPVETAMMERITNNEGRPTRGDFEALVPMRRYAAPEEIAAAALYLCSDDASYVTGVALPVDGGLFAS